VTEERIDYGWPSSSFGRKDSRRVEALRQGEQHVNGRRCSPDVEDARRAATAADCSGREEEEEARDRTGPGRDRRDDTASILERVRGHIIWVEGIIGAGKTTAALELARLLELRAVIEPAETNPFLAMFYQDPKRWSFAMQMFLLRWRFAMQNEAMWASMQSRGAILDRGLPGDRVFAQLHARRGNMHELEWLTYEQWFDTMACALRPPAVLLYLDTAPEVALERTRTRGREAESSIPLEYLQALADGYNELIEEIVAGRHAWSQGIRVVRVPWNDGPDVTPILQILESVAPGMLS